MPDSVETTRAPEASSNGSELKGDESIERQTLSTRAYERLKELILRNELKPDELITIGALSDRLGISKTPVREALARLAAENLVNVFQYKEIRVTELSEQDIGDVYEARLLLEPYLAECAASTLRDSPSERSRIERLREIGERVANELSGESSDLGSGLMAEYRKLDTELGSVLAELPRNVLLRRAYELVLTQSVRARWYAESWPDTQQREMLLAVTREHLAIIQALASMDGRACEAATRTHLRNAQERTLRTLERRRVE